MTVGQSARVICRNSTGAVERIGVIERIEETAPFPVIIRFPYDHCPQETFLACFKSHEVTA